MKLLFLCGLLTLVYSVFSQDMDFSDYEILNNSTEDTPEPTTPSSQKKCAEPMIFRTWGPANEIDKCICIWPFLTTPLNNTCCEPFRQGPCAPGYFISRTTDYYELEVEPECIANPCLEDGLIPYNKTCHNVIERRPCNPHWQYFNETISEVVCIPFKVQWRTVVEAPKKRKPKCPPDSLKDNRGRCRRKL